MRLVILATLPGLAALTYFFGWGNLINIVFASIVALSCEALVLALRKRPIGFYLNDCSALLTAVLLGLALPPFAPWWLTFIGTAFAIIIAKQLYGGMGYNPFNPAMIAYALLLISFPLQMTTSWSNPLTDHPSFIETLNIVFMGVSVPDAFTMATPLDTYKHQVAIQTAQEITINPIFGQGIAHGWEWVSGAYLLGGLFLLYKRIYTWHIPASVLLSLTACAFIFGWDADTAVPPALHLLGGATMLCAFFIATDPVTASTTPLGKLWYGAGIGVLIYMIRSYGSYPDAVAFAVLLMNFAAPFIDYFTQPRTYGHSTAKRGIPKGDDQ
jgi:electron transport complex protein RnfD